MFGSVRIGLSPRALRYALAATLAFSLGSATVVTAGPVVSGFVGLIDGANTAKITASGELSVTDAATTKLTFDANGRLKVAAGGESAPPPGDVQPLSRFSSGAPLSRPPSFPL